MLLNNPHNDIICIQETWLTKQELGNLSIHSGFHGTGAATLDSSDALYHGHPPGGVAVLWRTSLDKYISPIVYEADWISGIQFATDKKKIVILCVYMPYECTQNEDRYMENLGILYSILSELDTTCVFILSDFNADISDSNSTFGNHLRQFCQDTSLKLSSEILLPCDTFTHKSESWHATSWLDHCLSSADGHSVLQNMNVLYSTSCADHFPFSMTVSIDRVPDIEVVDDDSEYSRVNWSTLTEGDIQLYSVQTDANLVSVYVPIEAICCKNTNCQNVQHVTALDDFYSSIVGCMTHANGSIARKKKTYGCRPGWSEYVADMHCVARNRFLIWRSCGKPKHGYDFDQMRLSRSQFKYALRFVKKHENTLRKESLAHKLAQCKPADFWKEICSMNMNKTTLPSSIAGTTGGTNIAELWRQHFSQLFNCIDDDVNGAILDHVFSSDMVVTSEEVDSAINMLVNNKSCGADGLFAENMKHGGKRLNTLLAMCFTGLFVHGFL